ncbi:DmsC/YnfH family molybdoenzyme membrane anchor subunit [Luteolibacter algae]|uniref:DmsC/YnfH family molybdoenzyme membrane anchor subunit n=1 Tax=Luteolibacter algae TaxID=454151 RepID=A0ABW5D7D0_9BACT
MTTLIDELLAEQSKLQTPVAKFSEKHRPAPDLEPQYRSLIPLTKPATGEQYAFEVSLDRCTGCKACVSACASLNGLDDGETWRDVGTLLGGEAAPSYQQTITSACHHCEDPGCMDGCPVGAYEKEEDTGIVRHLDDQCIGCSYCILKCPYDVPKYSKTRGIVRKCDMCHQRLAEGEAPACVQACPTEAIRIVKHKTIDNRDSADISLFKSSLFSTASSIPDSKITLPSTRYVGRKPPLTAHAADREKLSPEHAHWPLVFMLVLTQAGLGLAGSASLQSDFLVSRNALFLTICSVVLFNFGMIAATLHLGQPLKAWRFFLGLRTSWLSREILAFSVVAPLPLVLLGMRLVPDFPFKDIILLLTTLSAIPAAMAAIFTSVMIYQDTKRVSWRFYLTSTRFYGSFLAFLLIGLTVGNPSFGIFAAMAIIFKLLPEARVLKSAGSEDAAWDADLHSARLQLSPLRKILNARVILAFVAAFAALVSPWLALPVLLGAEILERQLFFQSCHAPKMPGHFG